MARQRINPEDQILIATDSGAVEVKGQEYTYTKGVTRIRASHPMAKAAPHSFEKMELHYDVEQATAAPGEKRG